MNPNGIERPKSARFGKFSADWQLEDFQGGRKSLPGTISYSGIPAGVQAVASFFDMNDDTRRAVCGGTVQVIGASVGVLEMDTYDGQVGNFLTETVVRLPVLSSDTLAIGALLYWDATNYRLTTTASGNTKAGYLLPYDNISTTSETISTAVLGTPHAAKWVRIQLQPN